MIYCNGGPIASQCYLSREATQSGMNAIVQAITDLTTLGNFDLIKGFDLRLDFGFSVLRVNNKNLKVSFDPAFAQSLNRPEFEDKVRK